VLKDLEKFLPKLHHEVVILPKVKFGPFEGRSWKSELSRRPADLDYAIITPRPNFVSKAPKHDPGFCFAWFSAVLSSSLSLFKF
jgi:hypothetical protein